MSEARVTYCIRPPEGWYCTLGFDHEGACSVVSVCQPVAEFAYEYRLDPTYPGPLTEATVNYLRRVYPDRLAGLRRRRVTRAPWEELS